MHILLKLLLGILYSLLPYKDQNPSSAKQKLWKAILAILLIVAGTIFYLREPLITYPHTPTKKEEIFLTISFTKEEKTSTPRNSSKKEEEYKMSLTLPENQNSIA